MNTKVNEGKLISGKEALIALANDRDVEYLDENLNEWVCMDMAHHFKRKFRLKPRTITINNIEVPVPFKPKEGEMFFYLNGYSPNGFGCQYKTEGHSNYTQFGAWRTESEIKQVVEALREVFK